MTAKEKLELAVRTFTEIRDLKTRIYTQHLERGLTDQAAHTLDELVTWNTAIMMLTNEAVLMDTAQICGIEVNEP